MNEHRGIPTRYKGINFRSRLEAKYAALFDLLGWRWTYEPFDLNGWIPDFVLHGGKPRRESQLGHRHGPDRETQILVEVKPVTGDGRSAL